MTRMPNRRKRICGHCLVRTLAGVAGNDEPVVGMSWHLSDRKFVGVVANVEIADREKTHEIQNSEFTIHKKLDELRNVRRRASARLSGFLNFEF